MNNLKITSFLCTLLLAVTFSLPAANAQDSPKVTVESTGKEPRQLLKSKAKAGQTEMMVVFMDMDTNTKMNGNASPAMKLPKQKMHMLMKVEEVTEEDNLVISYRMEKIEVIDTDPPSPLTAQMKPMMQTLVGTSGKYTVTRLGVMLDSSSQMPEGVNPAMAGPLGNMDQMLSSSTVAMPDEPIGVGAMWTVNQDTDTGMFNVKTQVKYTVVSLDGDTYELKAEVTQSADAQDIDVQGMNMKLKKFDGKGSGSIKQNLNEITPNSSMSIKSDVTMQMPMGNQTMSIDTTTDATVNVSKGEVE